MGCCFELLVAARHSLSREGKRSQKPQVDYVVVTLLSCTGSRRLMIIQCWKNGTFPVLLLYQRAAMTVGSDVIAYSQGQASALVVLAEVERRPPRLVSSPGFAGAKILMDYENMSNPHANKGLRFCWALVIKGLPIKSFCQLRNVVPRDDVGDENSKRN